jgi:hypothetical protein
MKNLKPILISIAFIIITGLLVWLGPEISQTSLNADKHSDRKVDTSAETLNADDAPPVFKAISNKMGEIKGTRLGKGAVQNIKMKGQEKTADQRHLDLVKEVKGMLVETCLKADGDFAKIQASLNEVAATKKRDPKLNFTQVVLELRFINKSGDKCNGTVNVTTNHTGQEVKF